LAKYFIGQIFYWPNILLAKYFTGQLLCQPNIVPWPNIDLAKRNIGQIWFWAYIFWQNIMSAKHYALAKY
jgi:hypothetical protein